MLNVEKSFLNAGTTEKYSTQGMLQQ